MSLLPSRRERRSYPVASFRDEMDRLFDGFFGPGWGLMSADLGDLGRFPAVDVHETDDAPRAVPHHESTDGAAGKCFACGQERWWQDEGRRICAVCHPPPRGADQDGA